MTVVNKLQVLLNTIEMDTADLSIGQFRKVEQMISQLESKADTIAKKKRELKKGIAEHTVKHTKRTEWHTVTNTQGNTLVIYYRHKVGHGDGDTTSSKLKVLIGNRRGKEIKVPYQEIQKIKNDHGQGLYDKHF